MASLWYLPSDPSFLDGADRGLVLNANLRFGVEDDRMSCSLWLRFLTAYIFRI